MPIVIATWPGGDVSIVIMRKGFTAVDLYEELDAFSDPLRAKCYVARPRFDEFFVHVERQDDGPSHADVGKINGTRIKPYPWPSSVVSEHVRSVYRRSRAMNNAPEEMSDFRDAKQAMPEPPSPKFTAEEINKMAPFSGVYVSWDDDGKAFYVGESAHVPSRVRSSRPEIANRAIGVIKCDPSERRRIECYFIGVLNPPGNSQSTHRMSEGNKE
jgi:hypothetical protein